MTTARALLDRHISEPAWQRQVLELAHLHRWVSYHTYDSRRSEAGWPDLALCRPPRLLLVELKSSTGRVSKAQRRWLDLLGGCPGVEVYCWRPADWPEVVAVLVPRSVLETPAGPGSVDDGHGGETG